MSQAMSKLPLILTALVFSSASTWAAQPLPMDSCWVGSKVEDLATTNSAGNLIEVFPLGSCLQISDGRAACGPFLPERIKIEYRASGDLLYLSTHTQPLHRDECAE